MAVGEFVNKLLKLPDANFGSVIGFSIPAVIVELEINIIITIINVNKNFMVSTKSSI